MSSKVLSQVEVKNGIPIEYNELKDVNFKVYKPAPQIKQALVLLEHYLFLFKQKEKRMNKIESKIIIKMYKYTRTIMLVQALKWE